MIWFKIIYAASTYDFAVNIIMVINIWYSWFACKLFMLLREYEYFQCFNIYVTKNMNTFNALTFIQ